MTSNQDQSRGLATSPWFVRTGEVCFRHRGLLLPIAVVLLLLPSPRLTPQPVLIGLLGLAVALIGQVIRSSTIGLAYIIRGGKDHHVYAEDLVTQGLYAHCRNPMYFANTFLLAGLALASNSWVFVLVGVPLALVVHRAIIAAEENFLRGKFGAEYDAYCARVPRCIPRLQGLSSTFRTRRFDWHRVLVKEYAKPFDWLAALVIVVAFNALRSGQAEVSVLVILGAVLILRLALWLAVRVLIKRASPAPAQ